MPSFSNMMRSHVSRDQRERRGRGGKNFSLRLSVTTAPTRLHLAMPTKLYVDEMGYESPYYRGNRHYIPPSGNKPGNYLECAGDQCVICAYTNPQSEKFGLDIQPDPRLAKIRSEPYYAVSGWVEESFHKVQYQSKDGQGTYWRRERCQGNNCDFCKEKWPRVFGNKFYYAFSASAWGNRIHPLQMELEKFCRCGSSIYIPEYICGSCKAPIFDVCNQCDCGAVAESIALDLNVGRATCTSCQKDWPIYPTDDPGIMERSQTETKCPACGVRDLPQPSFLCSSENVHEADPYNIFDCQMTLKKESEDQKASIVVVSYKIQPPDPRLFDPKYQGLDQGNEKAKEDSEWMPVPLDLTTILTPEPPAVQAQLLGVDDPFRVAGAGQPQPVARPQSRPYVPRKATTNQPQS